VSDGPTCFILRIQNYELERQLFSRYSFYVGIKRGWSTDVHVLFVRKDRFIGSGIIGRVVALEELQEQERRMCIENNWHAKLVFSRLARFLTALAVQDTPIAGRNPLALHGATILPSDMHRIEELAAAKIIS
jgi:hypothetical protein